ncbi:MAG: DUF1501 domain-containing protein [Phycisphaera sp.]|nr:DUF1501 domain-containing protein [Phycisphaera sp.]
MSDHERAFSRRRLLKRGVTLASLTPTVPWFVQNAAEGLAPSAATPTRTPGADRILVIVQLGGGNDGLNTVVPFFSDDYRRARPRLALGAPGRPGPAGAALPLDETAGLGLHPSLTGLRDLHADGLLGVIQGVGYPNPNRSHFASMDIWQTGRTDGQGTGWLGRYFDHQCNGTPSPQAAIALGRDAPLALVGDVQKPIAFEDESLFRWRGDDLHPAMARPYESMVRAGSLAGVDPDSQAAYLMRTSLDAQVSSDRIRAAVRRAEGVSYPRSGLANQLRLIAAMIRDEMPTRVYYAKIGGFDTHGGQLGSHANLMRQVGDAIAAFQGDLDGQGVRDHVLTMVFSEFGRRVAENGSAGTDHGTAAPMFLVGGKARPGVVGDHPSLVDLDRGDLRHTIDFRSVYAGILSEWFQVDPRPILGADHPSARLIVP